MNIITACFKSHQSAANAIQALQVAGFSLGQRIAETERDEFQVSPHAAVSEGAEQAAPSAATSAVVGGIVGVVSSAAALTLLGPGAVIAGAGVGAYVGSLVGALAGMRETPDDETGGDKVRVTIAVAGETGKAQALEILGSNQASDITEHQESW